MTRFLPRCAHRCLAGLGLAICLIQSSTFAVEDFWKAATNGNWETPGSWAAGFTPGNADSATFNLAGTYTTTFGVAPLSIQRLIVSAGNVTFQSSGSTKTLGIDATGGNNTVFVSGSGTVMNLGGSSGNPMTLYVPAAFIVSAGGSFVSRSASSISDPGVLQVGQIVNGVMTPGTSSFTLQAGSTMSLGGDLTIANQSVPGVVGTLTISGTGSSLLQYQNSAITVGCVGNGHDYPQMFVPGSVRDRA